MVKMNVPMKHRLSRLCLRVGRWAAGLSMSKCGGEYMGSDKGLCPCASVGKHPAATHTTPQKWQLSNSNLASH